MGTEKDFKTIEQELARRKEEHSAGITGRRVRRRWVRRIVLLISLVFFTLSGVFFVNFLRLNGDLIEGHIKKNVLPGMTAGLFPLEVGKITGDLIHGVEMQHVSIQNPQFKKGGVMVNIPLISLKYSLYDVFWGKLVLERLVVSDPVVVLSRDPSGRPIWDFGLASDSSIIASMPRPVSEKADPQVRAEALADRYLRHIEIRNMSILIPQPRDLLPDQTFARLLRLPPGNLHLAGLNVLLQKFPHKDYSNHILRVFTAKDSNIAMLQWNRDKETGNYDLSIDAFKQRLIFAVQNIGAAGRKMQLYDERNKNRLNIKFGLTREGSVFLNRVVGLQGNISLDDLSTVASVLPEKSSFLGSLGLVFSAKNETTPILDTDFHCRLASVSLKIPEVPPLNALNADITFVERKALVRRLEMDIDGVCSHHEGLLDCVDSGNIIGSFSSDLAGEKMLVSGAMKQVTETQRKFTFQASREAGKLEVETVQEKVFGMNRYHDMALVAEIKDGKRISDLVPSRLFPSKIANLWSAWITRIDLVGPVVVRGTLPSSQASSEATMTVCLNGAAIISKTDPNDRVQLNGTIDVASTSFQVTNLSAAVDSLAFRIDGGLRMDSTLRKIEEYAMSASGELVQGKPFVMTGKRLQSCFGLAKPLPFDSVTLEGNKILTGNLSSRGDPQKLTIEAKKIRLKRGKKVWWVDDVLLEGVTPNRLDACRFKPRSLDVAAGLKFFGFPVKAEAKLDVASETIQALNASMKGNDFNVLITALREVPEIDEVFKKRSISLSGAFNLECDARGKMNRPQYPAR